MSLEKGRYQTYIKILEKELLPSLGCTEPIAIAYVAAKAKDVLGKFPDKIITECSGNIIKNAKGVIVPTTGDLKGIKAATLLGTCGGDSSRGLEVLTSVTQTDLKKTRELLDGELCESRILDTKAKLHIIVKMFKDDDYSLVEVIHTHTGIVRIEKNGERLLDLPYDEEDPGEGNINYSTLNLNDIYEFANTVDIKDVEPVLCGQIEYNSAVAEEGLRNNYGENIGSTLIEIYGEDIKVRARAKAAAGSDARMSGCELPVIINSGSGNQGMTVSLPVIEFGKGLGCTQQQIYRALTLSNLIAIYQKSRIGLLSAYCGVVNAAAGAGAGITYLYHGGIEEVSKTITNTLANISGIICDGAKPSCAAKIASSVDAAIIGSTMALKGKQFSPGEGIVKDQVEDTVQAVIRLAKEGMKVTDDVILKIMVEE
ncbi:serine dehydratase subunit alpha family protein [Blautia liquoris]|uniref:UPF0597 protein INP51_11440 n=1 Tax=Blautia liquoris TaxID=2779518 RepID=A0A7M2RE65_9FIRM|nr:L-serine ammonia-lyase, iron-sulfur-dependent, subunit alpha [Blautia liquoris]QOV18613.1 serine dehydratase subunit alpha family protein [Blautia liquoris]